MGVGRRAAEWEVLAKALLFPIKGFLVSGKICRDGRKAERWVETRNKGREGNSAMRVRQHSCKSQTSNTHHRLADTDQEHLAQGGHEIILDIPMVLPQFPQNPQHRAG